MGSFDRDERDPAERTGYFQAPRMIEIPPNQGGEKPRYESKVRDGRAERLLVRS